MHLLMLSVAALVVALAPSASANWHIKAKSTCYESAEGTTKLGVEKGRNDEIVAACLDVAVTDPSVADHTLVFDSDTRTLRVIRNCDALVVCALSAQESCAVAEDAAEVSYKRKEQCEYELVDFGENDVDGHMLCKASESYSVETNRFRFKTTCKGNLSWNGTPCAFQFKSGRLFEESGTCPD